MIRRLSINSWKKNWLFCVVALASLAVIQPGKSYGRKLTGVTPFGPDASRSATLPYDPEIGNWRQLFVDDYRIESMTDVERKLHVGIKDPVPVLKPDKPWEMDAAYLYGTVLFDEEEQLYKMWYQTFHPKLKDMYLLYATSYDGRSWIKPDLGITEWHGSVNNNILFRGEIGTVVKDSKTTDVSRRYKMFGFIRPDYDVFFSSDGLHWTKTKKESALREGDVANAGYDPYHNNFYVLAKLPHPAGRATFLSRSTDFENWTTGIPVMVADDRDQAMAKLEQAEKMEIYGMSASPYEGGYIGFPWMFRITGEGGKGTGGDGHIDVQFAWSRDLEHWARPVRQAIIPNGIMGSFDDQMVFTSSAPVIRGDNIEMFYGAWDGPHGTFERKAYVGRAIWKRDRFLSLSNGGFTSGTVVIKPIQLDGSPLYVNCDMSHGELKAELLDANNKAISGFSGVESVAVKGDQLNAALVWNGNPSFQRLSRCPVKIRLFISGGDLFSLWQGSLK